MGGRRLLRLGETPGQLGIRDAVGVGQHPMSLRPRELAGHVPLNSPSASGLAFMTRTASTRLGGKADASHAS